ncbi:MAG: flavin reductase [Ruminococcaceae bacterium]|nr:flavin reductase [Oscillospiraceae bacterium]
MDNKALYNLSYGVYLLTANENGKDNGCIINTAVQIAENPARISISVIKGNLTCDMILNTGKFNLSALDNTVTFDLIRRFGMQSGRNTDKFEGMRTVFRSENGILYLAESTNMYLSCKVIEHMDLGSHILFIAELTDAIVMENTPSLTYAQYHAEVKPKPKAPETEKKQYVCTICGYVYEGDEIPEDYLCPLCQHGKEYFELQ